jgi:hypothetical protein
VGFASRMRFPRRGHCHVSIRRAVARVVWPNRRLSTTQPARWWEHHGRHTRCCNPSLSISSSCVPSTYPRSAIDGDTIAVLQSLASRFLRAN